MQPLIDCDVLTYEVGFGVEREGEILPFSEAEDLLERKIDAICRAVGATAPPKFYLTGHTNFRTGVAKRKPYKERAGKKPFHYKNLRAYFLGILNAEMEEGLEADDLMAIEQTSRIHLKDTVICTRDKDLRQVEGWQYGWECHNQPEFQLQWADKNGWLHLENNKKLTGVGDKFFFAQCLMGDTVDTIPGLPSYGPATAFHLLLPTTSYKEMFNAVLEAYKAVYGPEKALEELTEQAQLLWMIRKRGEMWKPYEE